VFAKLRQVGVDVRASDVVVSEVAQLRSLVTSDRIKAHSGMNGSHRPGDRQAQRRLS